MAADDPVSVLLFSASSSYILLSTLRRELWMFCPGVWAQSVRLGAECASLERHVVVGCWIARCCSMRCSGIGVRMEVVVRRAVVVLG